MEAFLSEVSAPRRFNWGAAAAIVAAVAIGIAGWRCVPQYLRDHPQSAAAAAAAKVADADPAAIDVQTAALPTAQDVPQADPAPSSTPMAQAPVSVETKTASVDMPKPAPAKAQGEPYEPSAAREEEKSPAIAATAASPAAATESLLSVGQLKTRFLSLVGADDIPEALTAFRALQSKLPADDSFVATEAPDALSRSYLRLSAQAFDNGEFESSAALLKRAQEFTPDAPGLALRRESLDRLAKLEHTLDNVLAISAESIDAELEHIQLSEKERFPVIRAQLAATFARRIVEVQSSSPQRANELLKVARRVFAGNPAIERLQPIDDRGGVAFVPGPREQRVATPSPSETDAVVAKPE